MIFSFYHCIARDELAQDNLKIAVHIETFAHIELFAHFELLYYDAFFYHFDLFEDLVCC